MRSFFFAQNNLTHASLRGAVGQMTEPVGPARSRVETSPPAVMPSATRLGSREHARSPSPNVSGCAVDCACIHGIIAWAHGEPWSALDLHDDDRPPAHQCGLLADRAAAAHIRCYKVRHLVQQSARR